MTGLPWPGNFVSVEYAGQPRCRLLCKTAQATGHHETGPCWADRRFYGRKPPDR